VIVERISRDQLARELRDPSHPVVVEVLAPKYFREFHLPSAINVPLGPTFGDRIQQAVPDKHQRVVVYCRNEACTASTSAADTMERLGYSDVARYEAGKEDWKHAGLPTEQ
jgi:rhodanese-related sulfurtransferase